MRPSQLLVAVAAFSSFSAALQWPGEAAGLKGVAPMENMLYRRQDKGNTDTSDNTDSTDNTDNTDSSNTDNGDSSDPQTTDKPTPPDDSGDSGDSNTDDGGKTTGDDSGGKKTTDVDPKQATKTFAATVQPGGVSIMTPAASSGPQYYKIGDPVTFGWNYTSLRATPTKIDVLVSCQSNQATYTIQANTSAGETGKVIWDSKKEATGTAPLPMAMYTLIIMDADSDITSTPEPGHLSVYNQFSFGMYIPEKYTPLSDFDCPTCSSDGISITPKQTMTLALITTTLTVFSFTWFARGFGVF